ncbi:NADPH:quinone reductase [Nakamurella silvestris]|nr:NADPH:quinone reductase [Nakamurella silvestris]
MSTSPTDRIPTGQITATEVVLPGIVEPDGLQLRRRTLPALARGQALVRVEATGVSFAEQGMRRGRYPGQPKFPFVPGYDLVGTVTAVHDPRDTSLVGTRIAAATKTGGWASHALVDVADLIPVPAGLDPAEVETLVVNGITAHQMLHRSTGGRPLHTILIHGAGGGVGTVLAQLARHNGIRVIGTASTRDHDALRAIGVEPIDYRDNDLVQRIRELAPDGVDAVFDHLGPASIPESFSLLATGGTLVAYGTAARLDDDNSMLTMFLGMLGKVYLWNLLPNRRHATFYNFWAGRMLSPRGSRRRRRADLTAVLDLLARDVLTPRISATFPLTAAAEALALAESRTTSGKIILIPAP